MIRAIIFDCFGVLIGKGFEYTYRLAGGDPARDRQFINDLLGQANLGLISDAYFNQEMARHLGISTVQWQMAVEQAELPDYEQLEYIRGLRPKYKTAILSNSNRGVLENKLGADWLDKAFDQIIVSADVGLVKPDPEIYKLAARRLGVNAGESVFIDDRQAFLEVAGSLGMKTILYKDFANLKTELEALI